MSEGYTLKEMVTKVLDHNTEMEKRQIRMDTTLTRILEQAEKTNGRVLNNENNIQSLKVSHGQAKTVFATLTTLLTAAWAVITFIVK